MRVYHLSAKGLSKASLDGPSFTLLLVMLLIALALLSGCDIEQPIPPTPTVTATATATSSPTATALPVDTIVPGIMDADSVTIKDSWNGLSSLGEVRAYYQLDAQDGALAGKASFAVMGGSVGGREVVTDVTIPQFATERFLSTLSESLAQEGRYDYDLIAGATDNYPQLSMTLEIGEKEVEFISTSQQTHGSRWGSIFQGGSRIPWALHFSGRTYVINSARPAEAYAILNPYLKKEILAQLIQDVGENPNSGIPDPTTEPPY